MTVLAHDLTPHIGSSVPWGLIVGAVVALAVILTLVAVARR